MSSHDSWAYMVGNGRQLPLSLFFVLLGKIKNKKNKNEIFAGVIGAQR